MPYSVPDPQQTTFASLFLHLSSLLPLSISLYIYIRLFPFLPNQHIISCLYPSCFSFFSSLFYPLLTAIPFHSLTSIHLSYSSTKGVILIFLSFLSSIFFPSINPSWPSLQISFHSSTILLHHPHPLLHFIPSLSLLITLLFLPSSPLPLFYHRLCNSSPSISASFSPALPAFPFPSPSPLLCFMLYLPFHFLPLPPLANPRIFFAAT